MSRRAFVVDSPCPNRVDEAIFDAMRDHLTDEEILEFTYITMMYSMHAVICRALRLEFDDRDDPIIEIAAPEDYVPENLGRQIAYGMERAQTGDELPPSALRPQQRREPVRVRPGRASCGAVHVELAGLLGRIEPRRELARSTPGRRTRQRCRRAAPWTTSDALGPEPPGRC